MNWFKKDYQTRPLPLKNSIWSNVQVKTRTTYLYKKCYDIVYDTVIIELRSVLQKDGFDHYRICHYWDCPKHDRVIFENEQAQIREIERQNEKRLKENCPELVEYEIVRKYTKASEMKFEN